MLMLIKLVYHNPINTAHSDLLKFYENISNASLQQPSAAHSFMTYTTAQYPYMASEPAS